MAAGRAMFEQAHVELPSRPRETSSYLLGSISGHNVAIVCLPDGGRHKLRCHSCDPFAVDFLDVQYGLMLSIGGCAPSNKFIIRLGDVVVSKPAGNYPGVVQYDFGKRIFDGRFVETGTLNRPPDIYCDLFQASERSIRP
ncbi:hypothetical protein BDV12DRAFT_174093 [Aspergillus spectabilis]